MMAIEYFMRTDNFVVWNRYPRKNNLLGFVKDDFYKLVDVVVQDWSKSDIMHLKAGMVRNFVFKRNTEKAYSNLEKKLHDLLHKSINDDKFVDNYKHLMPYYEFEGTEARKYFIDFIQVYGNNFRTIDYTLRNVLGIKGKIISIELYKKQNVVEKLTNKLGKKVKEISFPFEKIISVEGTTLSFELTFSANDEDTQLRTLAFDNTWV